METDFGNGLSNGFTPPDADSIFFFLFLNATKLHQPGSLDIQGHENDRRKFFTFSVKA